MNITIQKILDFPLSMETIISTLNDLQDFFIFSESASPPISPPDSKNGFGYFSYEILFEALEYQRQRLSLSQVDAIIGITRAKIDTPHRFLVRRHKKIGIFSSFSWGSDFNLRSDKICLFNLLQMGFIFFIEKQCKSSSCIRFLENDNYGTKEIKVFICDSCKAMLRQMGFSDGINQLTDSFNWINDQTGRKDEPLAEYKRDRKFPNLRVLSKYVEIKSGDSEKYFSESHIILVILHILRDLVPFLEGLKKLGARPENMFLLSKPYPYPQKDAITSFLKRQHINVFSSKGDTLSENDVRKLLTAVEKRIKPNCKLLIIEDGGYIVPLLHKEYLGLLEKCVGAVEQTTKGINKDKHIGKENMKIPILNVAKSDFKKEYEAPFVANAVVSNINRLREGLMSQGLKVLVRGFGSIGEQLSLKLRKEHMDVRVTEIRPDRILKAQLYGFPITNKTDVYIEDSKIIIGATGRSEPSITEEDIGRISTETFLVSASSDRNEIDVECLERLSAGNKEKIGLFGTKYNLDSKVIYLLGDGYPINFFCSEGVPNESIDPILTALFLCAISIVKLAYTPGIKTREVDKLLEKDKLCESILNIYFDWPNFS